MACTNTANGDRLLGGTLADAMPLPISGYELKKAYG
jgi:hypothetical protein